PRRPEEVEDIDGFTIDQLTFPDGERQRPLIPGEAAGGHGVREPGVVERQQLEAHPPLAGEAGAAAGQQAAGRGAPAAVQTQAGGDEDEAAPGPPHGLGSNGGGGKGSTSRFRIGTSGLLQLGTSDGSRSG